MQTAHIHASHFQSLLDIGTLLAAEDSANRIDLENKIEGVSNDISASIMLISRLLAAADPVEISDCIGQVGRLIEGLCNLNQRLIGDLGEFQLITSETVTS